MTLYTELRNRIAIILVCAAFSFAETKVALAQTFITFTNRVSWEAALTEGHVTEDFSDANLVAGLSVLSTLGKTTNGVWFDDVGTAGAFTTWSMTNATYAWGGTFDLSQGSAGLAAGLRVTVHLADGSLLNVADINSAVPGFFGVVCTEPFTRVQISVGFNPTFGNEIYSMDDLSFSTGTTNTAIWTHPTSGDWSTASHWDINAIPNVRSKVVIDPVASLTVTGPADRIFARGLDLSGPTNPAIATLLLQTNSGLWVKETISVGSNGRLIANGKIDAVSLNMASGSGLALNGNLELHTPASIGGTVNVGPHHLRFFDTGDLHDTVSLDGGTLSTAGFPVTSTKELRGSGTINGVAAAIGSSLVSTGTLTFNPPSLSLVADLNANGHAIVINASTTPSSRARVLGGMTLAGGSIAFPRYVTFSSPRTLDAGTLLFGELETTNDLSIQANAILSTDAVPPLTAFNHQVVIQSNLVMGSNSELRVNGRFFGYGAITATNALIVASDNLYLGKNSFSPPLEVNGDLTVESAQVSLVNVNVASGRLELKGNIRSGGSGTRATAATNTLIIYSGSISNASSCETGTAFIFDGAGIHRVGNLLKGVNERFDAIAEFTSNAVVEMTLQGGYNSFCERDRVSSKIIFNSTVSLNGALRVVQGQGISFSFGDTIQLFEFNGPLPTGGFDSVLLPALPNGLVWATNHLYTSGALRVGSTTDTDADGLADAWETEYFQTLSRDGSGDFDGDGATDLAEFISGTDPKNAASAFLIRHFANNVTNLVLTAGPLVSGRSYTVQQSYDLTPFSWFDTSEVTTEEVAGEVRFSFPPPTDNYFYRVRVSIPE